MWVSEWAYLQTLSTTGPRSRITWKRFRPKLTIPGTKHLRHIGTTQHHSTSTVSCKPKPLFITMSNSNQSHINTRAFNIQLANHLFDHQQSILISFYCLTYARMHFQSAKKMIKRLIYALMKLHENFPMLFSEDKIVLPSPLPFKLLRIRQ